MLKKIWKYQLPKIKTAIQALQFFQIHFTQSLNIDNNFQSQITPVQNIIKNEVNNVSD